MTCGTVTVAGDDPEPPSGGGGGGGGGGDTPVSVALECGDLPNEVTPGETVQIGYSVENTGDSRADLTVQLLRDGTLVDTRDVSVFPRTTRTGNFFTAAPNSGGNYTYTIETA